jgi:hypothetical protein
MRFALLLACVGSVLSLPIPDWANGWDIAPETLETSKASTFSDYKSTDSDGDAPVWSFTASKVDTAKDVEKYMQDKTTSYWDDPHVKLPAQPGRIKPPGNSDNPKSPGVVFSDPVWADESKDTQDYANHQPSGYSRPSKPVESPKESEYEPGLPRPSSNGQSRPSRPMDNEYAPNKPPMDGNAKATKTGKKPTGQTASEQATSGNFEMYEAGGRPWKHVPTSQSDSVPKAKQRPWEVEGRRVVDDLPQ